LTWQAFGGRLTGRPRSFGHDECLELVDRTLDRSGHAESLFEKQLRDDEPPGGSIEPHISGSDEAVTGQDR
jgi:hypothetical protein